MSTSKCDCGARWRTNYPFGRKSKGKTTMINGHANKCQYKQKGI